MFCELLLYVGFWISYVGVWLSVVLDKLWCLCCYADIYAVMMVFVLYSIVVDCWGVSLMTYVVMDLWCLVPRTPNSFVQFFYIVVYLLLRSVTYISRPWLGKLGLAPWPTEQVTREHWNNTTTVSRFGFRGDGFHVPTGFGCGYAVSLVTVFESGSGFIFSIRFRFAHGAPTPNPTRCHSY